MTDRIDVKAMARECVFHRGSSRNGYAISHKKHPNEIERSVVQALRDVVERAAQVAERRVEYTAFAKCGRTIANDIRTLIQEESNE